MVMHRDQSLTSLVASISIPGHITIIGFASPGTLRRCSRQSASGSRRCHISGLSLQMSHCIDAPQRSWQEIVKSVLFCLLGVRCDHDASLDGGKTIRQPLGGKSTQNLRPKFPRDASRAPFNAKCHEASILNLRRSFTWTTLYLGIKCAIVTEHFKCSWVVYVPPESTPASSSVLIIIVLCTPATLE